MTASTEERFGFWTFGPEADLDPQVCGNLLGQHQSACLPVALQAGRLFWLTWECQLLTRLVLMEKRGHYG